MLICSKQQEIQPELLKPSGSGLSSSMLDKSITLYAVIGHWKYFDFCPEDNGKSLENIDKETKVKELTF
jgi:hypothetical protein